MQIQISSKNLRTVARNLHTAAAEIPKELADAARRAMGPLPNKLKGSALSTLPKHGGLNRAVAFNGRFRVYQVPSGSRLVVQHQYDIAGLNKGTAIHPLFGNKSHWFRQGIRPGWFDRVIDQVEPAARREMEQALTNTARKAG